VDMWVHCGFLTTPEWCAACIVSAACRLKCNAFVTPPSHTAAGMMCCAVLCCAVPCRAVPCCAVLWCGVGAELSNIVNEALLLTARRGGDAVGLEELLEGLRRTR